MSKLGATNHIQIQYSREEINNALSELLKNESFVNEHLRSELVAVIRLVRRNTAREMIPLIDKLFTALDHADFSNGIVAFGVDEGEVRTKEYIERLRKEYQSLKEWLVDSRGMIPNKLIPLESAEHIYARPDGVHYHLSRECPMLAGRDFERFGYIGVTARETRRRRLRPCACAYATQAKSDA